MRTHEQILNSLIPCVCTEMYKSRNLADPDCARCNNHEIILEAMKHAVEQESPQWISVKDRLPLFMLPVLCYSLKDGIVIDSYKATLDSGMIWFNGTKFYYREDVTHWMPLPPKP